MVQLTPAGSATEATSMDADDRVLASVGGTTRRVTPDALKKQMREVDAYDDLDALTSDDVPTDAYLKVLDGGAILQGVASGETITTSGGAKLVVVRGPEFDTRSATTLGEIAKYPDGTIGYAAGMAYEADSSAIGAASAGNDVSVDGIAAYGVAEVGHVGGSLLRLAALGVSSIKIAAGEYALDEGLDLSGVSSVELTGDVTLDFTSITDAADVPGRGYLNLDGGSLTALPNLGADTTVGATSITLASAPSGLAVGDWICIYNPTDYSFSGFKANYRDGQWCKVAGISGTTVKVYNTILRAFVAATVEVYKHPGTKFDISGPGNIIIKESVYNDASLNAKAGFAATGYVDADFSKVRSTQADYGAMLIRLCMGLRGGGYKVLQSSTRTSGYNYGVVLAGCQDVDIQGDFYGYNHAFTVGGGNGPGYVPTRYVKVSGTFRAHPDTTIGAANFHGHCEYIHYDGVFDGAVSGGGDYIKVSGVVRAHGNQSCFYMNEMRGANVDVSGVRFETQGNPNLNTSGVIDIGANATNQMTADTVNGGTINLRGATIDAPNSARGLVIRNRGCTQDVALDMTGVVCDLASGGFHYVDALSGSNFTDFYMRDARLGTTALNQIKNIDNFHGWEIKGEVELTTLTSQPNRSTEITFQAPWNLTPTILTTLNGARIVGGKAIVCGAQTRSNTNAFIFINSADNANFSSSESCKIGYRVFV